MDVGKLLTLFQTSKYDETCVPVWSGDIRHIPHKKMEAIMTLYYLLYCQNSDFITFSLTLNIVILLHILHWFSHFSF